jgi:hypothetical protein
MGLNVPKWILDYGVAETGAVMAPPYIQWLLNFDHTHRKILEPGLRNLAAYYSLVFGMTREEFNDEILGYLSRVKPASYGTILKTEVNHVGRIIDSGWHNAAIIPESAAAGPVGLEAQWEAEGGHW